MNHPATFFQIIVPARCIFSYERRSAPAAPSSARPAAPYLHAASGKPSFCCQTSAAGCTSRRKPPAPGSPPLAPYRGGLPVLFRRAAPDQSPGPAPEARHTQSGQRPARQNISDPVIPTVSGSAPWQQCLWEIYRQQLPRYMPAMPEADSFPNAAPPNPLSAPQF